MNNPQQAAKIYSDILLNSPEKFTIELYNGVSILGCTILGSSSKWSNSNPQDSYIELEANAGRHKVSPFEIKRFY